MRGLRCPTAPSGTSSTAATRWRTPTLRWRCGSSPRSWWRTRPAPRPGCTSDPQAPPTRPLPRHAHRPPRPITSERSQPPVKFESLRRRANANNANTLLVLLDATNLRLGDKRQLKKNKKVQQKKKLCAEIFYFLKHVNSSPSRCQNHTQFPTRFHKGSEDTDEDRRSTCGGLDVSSRGRCGDVPRRDIITPGTADHLRC